MELSLIRMWIQLYKLAILNLQRNFFKNVPIFMSVSLGFVGLILISSYVIRINHAVEVSTIFSEAKGHLAVLKLESNEKYFTNPKRFSLSNKESMKILEIISNLPSLDFASRVLLSQGFINNDEKNTAYKGIGIEKIYFQRVFNNPKILNVIPDWIMHEKDFMKGIELNGNQISITNIMLKNLQIDTGQSVQLISQSFDGSFSAVDTKINSIHSTGKELKEPVSLLSTYENFSELNQTDSSSYIALFLKDSSKISKIKILLENQLKINGLKTQVFTFEDSDWNHYYTGTRAFLYFVGSFFSLLVMTGCFLSILSFNFLNFQERKQEIGTLRSLGFNQKLTQIYFLFETFLLLILSLSIGLIIAFCIIYLINHSGLHFSPPGLSKEVLFLLESNFQTTLTISITCIILCLVISWYQAAKLIKEEISNLLHNSGL